MTHNCYFININNPHLALDMQNDCIDGGVFEDCEHQIKENLNIDVKIMTDKFYNNSDDLLKALNNDDSATVLVYCNESELIFDKKRIEAIKLLARNNPNNDMWDLILKAQLID